MSNVIYLAGGCFWGCQKYFDMIPGVTETEVGYANGSTDNPTYEQVKDFLGGHLGLWKTIEVDEEQEAAFRQMYHNAFELDEEEIVESLYSTSNRIISDAIIYADRQAGYLWMHGSHTGSPLGLFVKGAVATEFNTCSDNTLIPQYIKRVANY